MSPLNEMHFYFIYFLRKETSKFEILDPKDRSVALIKIYILNPKDRSVAVVKADEKA